MEWQVGFWRRAAGRVRYSCLKEAAGEEASMQIQWCCRDEKDSGNRWWSESERGPGWFDCSLRAKVSSQELGGGQRERTPAAGDGKHRASEIGMGVSCGGSGAKGWRTELDLGRGESLDNHHAAATLGTEPKWVRLLGQRGCWFGWRWLFCVE